MKTRILVDLHSDDFPDKIFSLYQQYLTIIQNYIYSKGYVEFNITAVDRLIDSAARDSQGNVIDPMPEQFLLQHFVMRKTLNPETVFMVFVFPYGVKPILQLNNPNASSFPRPDLGYCYVRTPLLTKDMDMTVVDNYLYPLSHELFHLLLWRDTEPWRTYLIDVDPRFVNVVETFGGMEFQKLPRIDEK